MERKGVKSICQLLAQMATVSSLKSRSLLVPNDEPSQYPQHEFLTHLYKPLSEAIVAIAKIGIFDPLGSEITAGFFLRIHFASQNRDSRTNLRV